MIFNRQLQSFMVVARCGSLLQASNELYITPAALAQQMNLLEASLGFRLFDRSNKGMQLTPSGKVLYVDLEPIFQKLEDALCRAEAISRQEENELKIGYHLEDDLSCFENVCIQLHTRSPQIQFTFEAMEYEVLPESVKGGSIDLAIMYCKERIHRMGLCFNRIMKLQPYVWVPPQHPLANKKLLHIPDLRGETLLLPKPCDVESADVFRNYLKKNEPEICIGEIKYDRTLMLNSCIDNSLILLPITLGKKVYPMVPLPLLGAGHSEVGFVYRKTPSNPAQMFMDLTREVLNDDDKYTI